MSRKSKLADAVKKAKSVASDPQPGHFKADQLNARKEIAVLKQYAENRLRKEDSFTPFERAVLTRHGIISDDKSPAASASEPAVDVRTQIQNCTTQSELAVMLARHFHGRFKGDISQQRICDWKLGKHLRSGVPLPPAKEGVYFIGTKWVEWMAAHILTDPRYSLSGATQQEMDIHDRAYIAKSEAQIIEKEIKRVHFELTQARYITVDVARNTRRGALKLMHNTWRRRLENVNTKARAEWLVSRLTATDMMAFREFDAGLEKQTVDFVESDYLKIAAQEPEKEQARQLAEESAK